MCFERLKDYFIFFQTLVAASVDYGLQKGGKNVVNIHITMNCKVGKLLILVSSFTLILFIYVNNDEVIIPKGFLTKLSHPCFILLSTFVFFLSFFLMYL